MAKKFHIKINNSKSTLGNHASLIEKQAEAAQKNIITNLEIAKMERESKVQSMLDFAPDSTYSLKPNATGFEATKWATELQALKVEIAKYDEALDLAITTYNDLFTESK